MNTNITAFKDLPRIFSINPVTVTEAWTDVVIMGKNFRDIPFQGKVFIDGVEQGEYLVSWSDSKIIFRTNPKITKSGKLKVSPVDRPFTNELQFNYNYK